MTDLPVDASQEQIIAQLSKFKIHALNYTTRIMSSKDAQHLEPREVKQLTDIVLSLEDSIKTEDSEGKQARTVQRLLSKYTSNSDGEVIHKSSKVVVNDVRTFYTKQPE